MTSVYRRTDSGWELAVHQQTPLPSGEYTQLPHRCRPSGFSTPVRLQRTGEVVQ